MELIYDNKKSVSEILSKSKNKNFDDFIPDFDSNYVFYGDNFDVLSKLINSGYEGKIDLVYIDPPFATNNSFMLDMSENNRVSTISYSNNGIMAYDDNIIGDEFIEFIRERLILIQKLLSDEGSIYLHIDDDIGNYIKIVMDEVFGKNNYLNEISRRKSNPKNFSRRAYGNEKDTVLFYAKKRNSNIFNNIRIPYDEEELESKFKKIDSNGNRYTTVPIHAPGESSGVTGEEWHGMLPPNGRHWRTSPDELTKLNDSGLIEWSKTGNPRLKKFAKDSKGKKIQDMWLGYKDKMYPDYPTQKNQDMLDMIIQQSSNENSIVLDAFAGSGSTLLSAKKFGRRFIGIDQSKAAIKVMEKKLEDDVFSSVNFIEVNKKQEI